MVGACRWHAVFRWWWSDREAASPAGAGPVRGRRDVRPGCGSAAGGAAVTGLAQVRLRLAHPLADRRGGGAAVAGPVRAAVAHAPRPGGSCGRWASPRSCRCSGPPNATSPAWPPGCARPGRVKNGEGPGRVAVLRRRGRAAAAAAPDPHLGPPWPDTGAAGAHHPGGAGVPGRHGLPQTRLRRPARCRPPAVGREHRAGVGQLRPPRQRRHARTDRDTAVVDGVPAAALRPGPESGRGRVVSPETQPGQPGALRPRRVHRTNRIHHHATTTSP